MNVGNLCNMLSFANSGGIIDEVVLRIDKKGWGVIDAVDITNTLFHHSKIMIDSESREIGIGSISLIERYLEKVDMDSVKINISEKRITIRTKSGGQISCPVLVPGEVPTIVEEPDASTKILDNKYITIPLTKSVVEEYKSYVGLISPVTVKFSSRNGNLYIENNEQTNRFQFKAGKCAKEIEVEVYADFLGKVFNSLKFSEEEKDHSLWLGSKNPIIVKQSYDVWWAIMPIIGE